MDMISYMEENSGSFDKVQGDEFKKRDTFHIGKITNVNDDYTFDIKSTRPEVIKSVTAMASFEDKPRLGSAVLFLSGNEKTQCQILGRSPFIVGD